MPVQNPIEIDINKALDQGFQSFDWRSVVAILAKRAASVFAIFVALCCAARLKRDSLIKNRT